MKKNKLKIGDVAKQLGIKKSIIRQWEQEFNLKSFNSSENNRFYSSEDMHVLTTIKDLIRDQGLSIVDVKAHLQTLPAIKCLEKIEEPNLSNDNQNLLSKDIIASSATYEEVEHNASEQNKIDCNAIHSNELNQPNNLTKANFEITAFHEELIQLKQKLLCLKDLLK